MNKTLDVSTYLETIDGLKKEIEPHVANLQASMDWGDFVGLFRVLRSVEEVADLPKTNLVELFGCHVRKRHGFAVGWERNWPRAA